jgi:natural product precursor
MKLVKLKLNKEMISNLSNLEMGRVKGGQEEYYCPVDNTYVYNPYKYYDILYPLESADGHQSCTGDCTNSLINCYSEGGCCQTNG